MGKFDFLALLGRLGLVQMKPGSAYLKGSSGPLKGARLLFSSNRNSPTPVSDLEGWLADLDAVLNIGMQAMEDSLCNWQKSPQTFIHFRG